MSSRMAFEAKCADHHAPSWLYSVIDTPSRRVVHQFEPGKAVLHLEFTPRGEAVWISVRDDNRVVVVDTASFRTRATLALDAPSGIFFTARAGRMGL